MKRVDEELVAILLVSIAIVLGCLFTTGCASLSLRPVQPNHALRKAEVAQKLGVDQATIEAAVTADAATCNRIDNTVTGFTATTVVLGVLSGSSGIASIFTDQTPRYVTGGIGVGLAASTALFTYLSTQFAQRYARQCAVNLGGR